MRYVVVVHRVITAEEIHGPDAGDVDEPDSHTCVERLVLCEDSRAVAKAVRDVDSSKGEEWAGLFEVVGGRAEQRAIVQKRDGGVVWDVDIS